MPALPPLGPSSVSCSACQGTQFSLCKLMPPNPARLIPACRPTDQHIFICVAYMCAVSLALLLCAALAALAPIKFVEQQLLPQGGEAVAHAAVQVALGGFEVVLQIGLQEQRRWGAEARDKGGWM